jgi:hypothetical protein
MMEIVTPRADQPTGRFEIRGLPRTARRIVINQKRIDNVQGGDGMETARNAVANADDALCGLRVGHDFYERRGNFISVKNASLKPHRMESIGREK